MKFEKLYVPMMNSNITEENRASYAQQLRAVGAEVVFIAMDYFTFFLDDRAALMEQTASHICYFRDLGFSVGIWFQAFGFGGGATNAECEKTKHFTKLRSICGNTCQAFCPEDGAFMERYLDWVTDIAQCKPDMMMLDDDLCQSVRPGIGCTCTHHRKLLAQTLEQRGLAPMPEDISMWPSMLFAGKATPHRKAFFDVMGDSLRRFCAEVRRCVDRVDPAMRVGFCAGFTSWDIEGVDAAELTCILAGEQTKPFLRLTGAPYWVTHDMHRFSGQRLNTVIEMARMQQVWCEKSERKIEIFCEADSYPRPRYHVPAAYLECFDMACRAHGGMGTLKYIFDYYAPYGQETGYTKHHLRNKPMYDAITEEFSGKSSRGVYVCEPMRKIADMTLPDRFAGEGHIMESAFSPAATMLTAHGIPTTYERENTDCAIAFGAAADLLFAEGMPKKVILDLPAAKCLTECGVDVGLKKTTPTAYIPMYERYENLDRTGIYVPGHSSLQFQWNAMYERCDLCENAVVMSVFEAEDGSFPSAYRYTDGTTEYYVLCVDATALRPNCSIFLSYGRQTQLLDFIGAVPQIKGEPGIYSIWKENAREGVVLYLNLCEDILFDFDIVLDDGYPAVTLFGAEGTVQGKQIHVTSSVAPYGSFMVTYRKDNQS